jgi:hypothetical protein
MKSLKVLSLKKSSKRNEYTFLKETGFISEISKFLNALNFKGEPLDIVIAPNLSERQELDTIKIFDKLYYTEDENYSFDFFFGKDIIIMIIRTNKDQQQKISETLFKFAEIVE